jgi:osmotically-inducible protein OsmY
VKAGVVLLQGRVGTLNQKGLASIVTASVHGVRGVFNLLRVEQPILQSGGAEPKVSGADHAKRHTG